MVGSDGARDGRTTGTDCGDSGGSGAVFEDDAETWEPGMQGEQGREEGLFGGEDGG